MADRHPVAIRLGCASTGPSATKFLAPMAAPVPVRSPRPPI